MCTTIIHMNAGIGCNLLSHWMAVLNALASESAPEGMNNKISALVLFFLILTVLNEQKA